MKKLVLALLVVSAVGCKRGGSQKLEGHWRGQKADGVPESAQSSADSFALGTEIIARDGQLAVQTPAGRNPPAAYVVDKEDATALVIHTEPGGVAETFTFNEKADVMVWKVDAQRTITLKKGP